MNETATANYRNGRARRYDVDFKRQALALIDGGKSLVAVSRELGVDQGTLKYWRKQAAQGTLGEARTLATETPKQREIRRLKMAVSNLQIDREILKKAVRILSEWHRQDTGR
ncbi:MAG: transposase [Verrucomicrobiales bacterium]|jgi:transposase|nr:transposase [Verrucomicrobiales bacterium]